MSKNTSYELTLPSHYDPARVEEMNWYVNYEALEAEAIAAREKHGVKIAATDSLKIVVVPIDVQRTFCDPAAQLYVGGRSGTGAVDDTRRSCEFIYRNASVITSIHPTMDTHKRAQVFHAAFWVDANGNHPAPYTMITLDDVESGKWTVNPKIGYSVFKNANVAAYLKAYGIHYVRKLTSDGKYPLMVWPYHAMLGGNEHALVPALHEALFYHNVLRESETGHEIKGGNPLTENYAITHPEVLLDQRGKAIAARNERFFSMLYSFDVVIIFGQAKSHCVAWTIDGILEDILTKDKNLARKIYLVEDLSSPVVTPELDFTDMADEAYQKFSDNGMNLVSSTTPISEWPGVAGQLAA